MKVGVCFSHPKKWNILSYLIMALTGSSVSHVSVVWSMDGINFKVREAHFRFRDIDYNLFIKDNEIVKIKYLEDNDVVYAAFHNTDKWIGKHYDYAGLIGELVVYFGKFIHKKIHNPIFGSKALFCSEAVARFLKLAKYKPAMRLNPNDVSPQDLFEIC